MTDFVSIKLGVAWKSVSKEWFLEEYVTKPVDVVAMGHTVGSISSKIRKSGIKPIKGYMKYEDTSDSGSAQELEPETGLWGSIPVCCLCPRTFSFLWCRM